MSGLVIGLAVLAAVLVVPLFVMCVAAALL